VPDFIGSQFESKKFDSIPNPNGSPRAVYAIDGGTAADKMLVRKAW
jgi:hypothetical protein